MLNSYTVILNRGEHRLLNMIPFGADGVWRGETPAVVLLNAAAVEKNIEKRYGDMGALIADGDKLYRLGKKLDSGMAGLDMPVYNLASGGRSDDIEIEEGRHRTFMLISSYGVEYLPVLVPNTLAPKFKMHYGYEYGYLTQTVHGECRKLEVIGDADEWWIGTCLERESKEIFLDRLQAEEAMTRCDWAQRASASFNDQ